MNEVLTMNEVTIYQAFEFVQTGIWSIKKFEEWCEVRDTETWFNGYEDAQLR